MPRDQQRGNSFILIIVSLSLLIAVGYFIMNYVQVLGIHKQATSAIDASALAVARDMSQAVVNCPLGRIGLMDDASAQQSSESTSQNPFAAGAGSPFKSDPRPIYSLNTIRATLRLDAIIASNSKVNNQTMLWLIAQHSSMVDQAELLLRQQIMNKIVYDKFGNAIDIQQHAYDAYRQFNSNSLSGQSKQISKDDIAIEFGSCTQSKDSGCATPTPKGYDSETSGQSTYAAYTNYSIPGITGTQIQLQPMSKSIGLISGTSFSGLSNNQAPVAVKVSVQQPIKTIASTASSQNEQSLGLQAFAQAAVGNINNHSPATGTLVITFPAGLPSGNFHSPSTGLFPDPSFNTVVGIMNGSQIKSTSEDGKSPYSRWNVDSKGNWQSATNGSIPWSGNSTSASYATQNFLGPVDKTGKAGVADSDPSVTLAFLVVDWLRTLGPTPNVGSIIDALNFDYQSRYVNASGSATPTIVSNIKSNCFMQAAYAEREAQTGQSAAIMRISNSGIGDPRNLNNWAQDPALYNRQQARMWGYIPADGVFPTDTKIAWFRNDGSVTTVDGNPASDLNDLLNKIIEMDTISLTTFNNAVASVKRLTNGQLTEEAIGKVYKENPRLMNAIGNASYCSEIAVTMKTHMKTLTSLGVKKINESHFVVAGSDFFPPTRAATESDLMSQSPCDTGQDSLVTVRDWCAAPQAKQGSAQSSLNFYKRRSEPVIGKNNKSEHFLPPALAATAEPSNFHQFVFRLVSGADGHGNIEISPQNVSPYGVVPCLKGQAHYQNVTALIMEAANDRKTLVSWQVQARDQNVNNYSTTNDAKQAPQPTSTVQYFTEGNSGAYDTKWCKDSTGRVCPVVVCEWALSCPVIQAPAPMPQPASPPAPPPPASPNCDSQLKAILMSSGGMNSNFLNMGGKLQLEKTQNIMVGSSSYWYFPAIKLTYKIVMPGNWSWSLPPVYASNNAPVKDGIPITYYEWDSNLSAKTNGQDLGWVWKACDPVPYAAHI